MDDRLTYTFGRCRALLDRGRVYAHSFQRSLPFQDALFDRWERARRLGFAPDASIYNSSAVFGNFEQG